jgi:hypothetical protein
VALYRYPNDRTDPAGAIPVYIVAAPTQPPYPSNQDGGAIPVIFGPVGGINAGPVPVRILAAGGGPPWPSDQGQDAGAIPVFNSTAANAMPVWDAT